MDVVGVESWSKQRVTLGDTGIEDADGDVLTLRRHQPPHELGSPCGLLDVRPLDEEGRCILCPSQFRDRITIQKQSRDCDFIAIDQPDFAVRKR